MKERLNKPHVFLSHSKKDIKYIERLFDDLRKCQIDSWLDDYEIRHGQPWLDAIFEDGMPTCDAVVAYLTPNSIESPVVRKEIDVAILQKLKDNNIAFLPYVSDSEIRQRLRPDLQVLQALEWNENNYQIILPRVVAEIWRSFLERTVKKAVQGEKIARLEAEMQLQSLRLQQEQTIFSVSERSDFNYIQKKLDRYEEVVFQHIRDERTKGRPPLFGSDDQKGPQVLTEHHFKFNLISMIPRISGVASHLYHVHHIANLITDELKEHLPKNLPREESLNLSLYPDLATELLMYGMVDRYYENVTDHTSRSYLRQQHSSMLLFTNKLERFKYWLAIEGKLPDRIQWSVEKTIEQINQA
jgi:hypothetical protein